MLRKKRHKRKTSSKKAIVATVTAAVVVVPAFIGIPAYAAIHGNTWQGASPSEMNPSPAVLVSSQYTTAQEAMNQIDQELAENPLAQATVEVDLSTQGNGSVLAYYFANTGTLIITGTGTLNRAKYDSFAVRENITQATTLVVADALTLPSNCRGLFANASQFPYIGVLRNINRVILNPNLNTSNVTDMSWMFADLHESNPDVANWDTGNVTTMHGMFYTKFGSSIADPNVSNWNTSNVTDMAYMFYRAANATPDVTNWNTGNVTNMSSMFWGDRAADPNVSNWNVGAVRNVDWMFSGGCGLTTSLFKNWKFNTTPYAGQFLGHSSNVKDVVIPFNVRGFAPGDPVDNIFYQNSEMSSFTTTLSNFREFANNARMSVSFKSADNWGLFQDGKLIRRFASGTDKVTPQMFDDLTDGLYTIKQYPQPQIRTIKLKWDVAAPNVDEGISNISSLLPGTTIKWADPSAINTKKAGTTSYPAIVTYPNGAGTQVINIPVIISSSEADNFTPQTQTVSVVQNQELPDPSQAVKNAGQLPAGSQVTWDKAPSTDTPGNKEGSIKITFPDGSTKVISVKVDVIPLPQAQQIRAGYNTPVPNADKGIKNWTSLPQGTTVTWDKAPDMKKVGTITYPAVMTYPNGTTIHINIPVNIGPSEADNFTPQTQTVSVVQNQELPDPSQTLKNAGQLPAGSQVTWDKAPSTVRPGQRSGSIKVTFPDGSTKIVPVKVDVAPLPQSQPIHVGYNTPTPNPEKGIKNFKDLPHGTTVKWEKTPDMKKTGTTSHRVTVTYPNGSTRSVDIPTVRLPQSQQSVKPSTPNQNMSLNNNYSNNYNNNYSDNYDNNYTSDRNNDHNKAAAAQVGSAVNVMSHVTDVLSLGGATFAHSKPFVAVLTCLIEGLSDAALFIKRKSFFFKFFKFFKFK